VTLALHANRELTSLDSRNNCIISSGDEALAAVLASNSTLSFLVKNSDLAWRKFVIADTMG